MPAPTRIITMPTAIALLSGNAAAGAGARFFGARSRSCAAAGARARLRECGGVRRNGRPPPATRRTNRPVGIGAAVLHARLEPVEFRRRRRHVGVGAARGAIGLRRGAAEIVGVGGDIAEAAHAGRLWRLRSAVVGTAARTHGSRSGGGPASCIGTRGGAGAARRSAAHRRADCAADGARPGRAAAGLARGRLPAADAARGGPGRRAPAGAPASGGRALARRNASPPARTRRRRAGWPSRARWRGFGFDLAHGLFERQPLAGDFGFGQRRLHAAQLRDQRRARPLVQRTAALAGRIGVQPGNGAGYQRVIISHVSSILRTFR